MKLILGTAQFSTNYGINNKNGKISFDEIKKILKYSKTNNIKTLDTAVEYPQCEKILGKVGIENFLRVRLIQ